MEEDATPSTSQQSEEGASWEESRDQVFSNALVWRTLGKFLSISDLQVVRLVSQEFNRNVMEETSFQSRVVITMRGSKIEQEVFEPTITWKHFRIFCFTFEDLYEDCEDDSHVEEGEQEVHEETDNAANFEWLYTLLADAESLCVLTNDIETEQGVIFPPLKNLLESAPNLKKLEVDIQLVAQSMKNGNMSLSPKACSMLENLLELHIRKSPEYLLNADIDDLVEEITDEVIMKSIRPLTQLMNNLRILTIENIVRERLSDLAKELNYFKVKHVLKLISNNKNNLTHLSIDEVLLWYYSKVPSLQTRAISSQRFPNLRVLRIRTHQRDHSEMNQHNLVAFLKAHPNLEEVDVTITPRFPSSVLHALHPLLKLKKLCIKTKRFEEDELDMWNFLTRMTFLQSFQVIVSRSFGFLQNAGSAVDILMALPKSVKSISLKGIPKSGLNFNFDPNPDINLSDTIRIDPMTITVLKLKDCRTFVDDSCVKVICKLFRMLRKLDISNNERITDNGLIPSELDGALLEYSLKDLKGLKWLSLAGCEQLTDACAQSIQFLELTFVDLSYNKKITTKGYLNVLQQNPSLEILKTDYSFPKDFSYEKGRFKSIEYTTKSRYDDSDDEPSDDSESDDSDQDFGDSGSDFDYGFDFYDSDEEDPLLFLF